MGYFSSASPYYNPATNGSFGLMPTNIQYYQPAQYSFGQNIAQSGRLGMGAAQAGNYLNNNPAGALSAAGNVANTVSSIVGQVQDLNALDAQDASTTDPITGRPILNTAELNAKLEASNPSEQGKGTVLGATASGAAAGTAIAPGIGTVIGGAIGFLGGLFGKNKIKKAAEAAQTRLKKQKKHDIMDYNTDLEDFSANSLGMDVFNARKRKQLENSFNYGIPASGLPIWGY